MPAANGSMEVIGPGNLAPHRRTVSGPGRRDGSHASSAANHQLFRQPRRVAMHTTQWARLRTESSAPLRRGAWYRVLRLTNSDAVLDVNQRPINVPRPALQIASHPPATWGIVPRPVNS